MSVRILLTAALLTATFASHAASTDAAPTARSGIAQLDKNGDGTISRDEAAARPRLSQNFDRIDANKDGLLSQDELRAARPHGGHAHARIDANGDGLISRDEAQNAPRLVEKFDAIDTNKDGMLTRDEMATWRSTQPRPSTPPAVKQ